MTNFYYLNKFNIGGTSFLNSSSEFSTNNVVSNILSQNAYDASQQLQFISSNDDDNGFDSFYSQYANIIGSDILSYTNQYVTTNDMALGDLVNNQAAISNLVADKTQFYFNKTADGDLYRYTSSNNSTDGFINGDTDQSAGADFNDLLVGYESYAKYIQDKVEGNPDATLNTVFSAANLATLGINYETIYPGKTQDEIKAIYQNLIDQIISEAKAIKPSTISKDDRIALEKDLETKEQELSTLDNLLLGTTSNDATYTFSQYNIEVSSSNKIKSSINSSHITDILERSGILLNDIYETSKLGTDDYIKTTGEWYNAFDGLMYTQQGYGTFTLEIDDDSVSQPAGYNIYYTHNNQEYYFKSEDDMNLITSPPGSNLSIDKYLKSLNVEFYQKQQDGTYKLCKFVPKLPSNTNYNDLFTNENTQLRVTKYDKVTTLEQYDASTYNTDVTWRDYTVKVKMDDRDDFNNIAKGNYSNTSFFEEKIFDKTFFVQDSDDNWVEGTWTQDEWGNYIPIAKSSTLETLENISLADGPKNTTLYFESLDDKNTISQILGLVNDPNLEGEFDYSLIDSFEEYQNALNIKFYTKEGEGENAKYILHQLQPDTFSPTDHYQDRFNKLFFETSSDGKFIFTDREEKIKYEKHIGNISYTEENIYPITAYQFDGTTTSKITISQTESNISLTNEDGTNLTNTLNNTLIDSKTILTENAATTANLTTASQNNIIDVLKTMEEDLSEARNLKAADWLVSKIQSNANYGATSLTVEELKNKYSNLTTSNLNNTSIETAEQIITTINYLNEFFKNQIDAEIEDDSANFSIESYKYYTEIIKKLDENNYDHFSTNEKNIIANEVLKNVKLSAAHNLMQRLDFGATDLNKANNNLTSFTTKTNNNISITTNLISGIKTEQEAYNTGILKVDTKALEEYLISQMNGDINASNIAKNIIEKLELKKVGNKIDNDIYIDIKLYSDLANTKSPKQWMTEFLSEQINNLDESFNKDGNILQSMGNNDFLTQLITNSEFDASFAVLDNSSFIKEHNIREEKFDILTLEDDRTFNNGEEESYENYLTFDVELPANGYLNKAIKDKNDNIIVPAGLLTKTYRLSATVLDNNGNYVSGPKMDKGTILPIGTKKFEKSSLLSKLTTLLTSYVSGGDSDGDISAASYVAKASMGIIENYLAENFNSQNPETVETYFYREFRELFNPNNKEGIIDVVINKEGTTEPQVIKMDFQLSGGILNAILSSQTFLEIGSKLEDRTRKEMELFESATALDIVQNINTQEYIYRLNILAGLEKINEEQGLGLDFSMVNKTLVSLGAGSSSNPWWQEYFPWFKGFYGNIPEGATAEDMFDENGNLTGLGQVGGMTIDPYILKINGVDYVLGKDNNQDGKINDATEILGIEDKIEDNFASLEALDIDKDGYISNEELKKGNIILQAVNQNERLNGASMSIDFVNGISLSSLKKENGTNNIYGTFSADMKNGSTVSGIQTFEQENYFHNLFGTYTDLSFLNKAETTTENQETTEEKTEETQIKYMAGVFSKKFSFLSNVESNSTEISVDKLIEDISWKLSIDNLSASQRYDIIDDIDITRSEDVITTEIENKLEQIKFSA